MCSHLFQSRGAEEVRRSSKTRSEPQLIMAVSTIVSGDAAKCVHLILCTQSNLFTHTLQFQLNESFIRFSSKSDTTFTPQQMNPDWAGLTHVNGSDEDREDTSVCVRAAKTRINTKDFR